MNKRILIVEDEKNIVDILSFNLSKEGYETLEAYDGEAGLQLALEQNPDLILLDLMLPKMNGFDVCRSLRRENRSTPVIMLTAREEETDKVLGLELGADDYITKPFDIREVLLRIQSVLRRGGAASPQTGPSDVLSLGDLTLTRSKHEVQKGGVRIELTPKEFELLEILMRNRNITLFRERIYEEIWGTEYSVESRTLDLHIQRLRKKLNLGAELKTVFKAGYRLEDKA